jgi:hypothetical protein
MQPSVSLYFYRICGQCSTLGEARVAVKAARAERELQRRLLLLDVLLEDRERRSATTDNAIRPGPQNRFASIDLVEMISKVTPQ